MQRYWFLRLPDWPHCYLDVESVDVKNGIIRGDIRELKTDEWRSYYVGSFDLPWEPVLTVEDILERV